MKQYTNDSDMSSRRQDASSPESNTPVKEEDRFSSRVESGLGRSLREGSHLSWGVVIMIAVAAYALFNLVRIILRFFS